MVYPKKILLKYEKPKQLAGFFSLKTASLLLHGLDNCLQEGIASEVKQEA